MKNNNILKNRYFRLSFLYFILFIILIFLNKLTFVTIAKLSEAIQDISIVILIMMNLAVLIMSGYNFIKAFKLIRFTKEKHIIHWTYSVEEWQHHIGKEVKLRYKDEFMNWGNFMFKFLIGFAFYIIFIVLFFFNELEIALLLIILGVILPIYLLIRELIKVKLFEYYNTKINTNGEFLLTNSNALINGELHDMKYTWVTKEIENGYLHITYHIANESEKQPKHIRVPIPKGKEDEAMQYVNPKKNFKSKSKKL